jgi:hypothetical protein
LPFTFQSGSTSRRPPNRVIENRAGLPGGTYTDTLTPGTTKIKASQITELRAALNLARSALSLSAISYTDPSLTVGLAVKSAHVTQLRNGVK